MRQVSNDHIEIVTDNSGEEAEKEPKSETKNAPRRKRPHTPKCSTRKPQTKDQSTQLHGSSKRILVKYRIFAEDKQKWMNVEGNDGSVVDAKLFRQAESDVLLHIFKEGTDALLKSINISEVGKVKYHDDPLHIGFQAGSTQHKLEFVRTNEVEYFIDKLENARKLVKKKKNIQRTLTKESREDGCSTNEEEDDSELKLNDQEWMMVIYTKNLLYKQAVTNSSYNPGTNRFWEEFKLLFSKDSKKSPEALRKIFLRKIFPNIHRIPWGREHTLTIYRELKRKIMPHLKLKLEQKYEVQLYLDEKSKLIHWRLESEIREKVTRLKRNWGSEKEKRREVQKEEEEEDSNVDMMTMDGLESLEESSYEEGDESDFEETFGSREYCRINSDFDGDLSF